ncbi:MAG: hypothetical protein IJQ96_08685 [Bacteroidales bacterium]|nr:hypothetical protein [Bacteroidales bacterium]
MAGLGDGGEGDSRQNGLLVEGECTVIIAASNTGKSIFTTQMAEAEDLQELIDLKAQNKTVRQIGAKYYPEGYDLERDMAKNARNALTMGITIDHMSGKHVREKYL